MTLDDTVTGEEFDNHLTCGLDMSLGKRKLGPNPSLQPPPVESAASTRHKLFVWGVVEFAQIVLYVFYIRLLCGCRLRGHC